MDERQNRRNISVFEDDEIPYEVRIQLIDLGLSSGTLWADRNLGADAPEKAGNYYRFGETIPFTEDSPEYVFDKIEESIAGTDMDAATVNLGKNYKMPTYEQFKEILDQC